MAARKLLASLSKRVATRLKCSSLQKKRSQIPRRDEQREYVSIAKTSPATAQRDLAELVNAGVLQLKGAGRGARYEMRLGERGTRFGARPKPAAFNFSRDASARCCLAVAAAQAAPWRCPA